MQTDKHSGTRLLESQLLSSRQKFLDYIRRRISDPELAEDILQDSLLRALQSAPNLRDEERLVPWFYRILQNAIVDAYRRRGSAPKLVDDSVLADAPEEPEEATVLCECFRDLIPTLKPEYAELIQILDLGNEATETAAERLGISSNNLKVRRHRARQSLRKRLEETCRTCAEHHCLDCTCKRE